MSYLLVVIDGNIREAVVVEEAHLLVEKAVDDVGPGVLPLDEADQLAVQGGTQVHGPVVAVQSHLEEQWQPVRPVERIKNTSWVKYGPPVGRGNQWRHI